MDTRDIRQGIRRECERRMDERRLVGIVFGSSEWRQNIERQYLMWPREDRRALDRRSVERRNLARRQSGETHTKSQPRVNKNKARDILNTDEKEMLADLFQPGRRAHR